MFPMCIGGETYSENLWSITGPRLAIFPPAIVSPTTAPIAVTMRAPSAKIGDKAEARIVIRGVRSPSICSHVASGVGSVKNVVVISSMLPTPNVAALNSAFHIS